MNDNAMSSVIPATEERVARACEWWAARDAR
jgi:hypothetical protein